MYLLGAVRDSIVDLGGSFFFAIFFSVSLSAIREGVEKIKNDLLELPNRRNFFCKKCLQVRVSRSKLYSVEIVFADTEKQKNTQHDKSMQHTPGGCTRSLK